MWFTTLLKTPKLIIGILVFIITTLLFNHFELKAEINSYKATIRKINNDYSKLSVLHKNLIEEQTKLKEMEIKDNAEYQKIIINNKDWSSQSVPDDINRLFKQN